MKLWFISHGIVDLVDFSTNSFRYAVTWAKLWQNDQHFRFEKFQSGTLNFPLSQCFQQINRIHALLIFSYTHIDSRPWSHAKYPFSVPIALSLSIFHCRCMMRPTERYAKIYCSDQTFWLQWNLEIRNTMPGKNFCTGWKVHGDAVNLFVYENFNEMTMNFK